MEKRDFARLENMCQYRFSETETIFHVCSRENHPVIFHNEEEYRIAMNIVAFAAFSFPEIRIYTFEVMDNHFHFVMSGKKEENRAFIKVLVEKLSAHPSLASYKNDIKTLYFKEFLIEDLGNLRNVISYVNRNGAVVFPDESVFTYRWGSNLYFFNREAKSRYEKNGEKANFRTKREIFRSAKMDREERVRMLDGYVSPLCYCHIREAESFFRNNRHYFSNTVRNIEVSKDIAKHIGEDVFYTDDDLFMHIRTLCSKKYGGGPVASLSPESKIEMAKELHYEYNAGNKQICRLLKLDIRIVSALFPGQG
ncbi:MAG: hypothetical protein MJY70_00800 [Bacteroidales bacterium]|nr:hypothetical protein [Bacteroidales bacterium]